MRGVLLINAPFSGIDSPSLALGLFKSRLRQDGIRCDVQHLNFAFAEMVGYDNYEFVLRLPVVMGGEQLFARSLFGDWLPSDTEYYEEIVGSRKVGPETPGRMEQIRGFVPRFLQLCLDTIPWHTYDIVGFTSLFEQNMASLSLARLVKQRYPDKIIVMGGANCEGIMGQTMLRCFPFLDYVCAGEADECFPELVKRLKYHHPVTGLRGVAHREGGDVEYAGNARLMEDLDSLPIPDYDDYFERLRQSPLRPFIRSSVLMESARGCWWGDKSQCTFCGLNGTTMRFRTKAIARTLEEITCLLGRYDASIVRFVDNILGPNYFRDLLPEIARRGLKANYICEVKSNLKKPQIRALADAGVTVQAGIENLSSHVLDLMAKGSNSLMNIQTLKWCKQLGVMADWNLIYGFPGETSEDYRDNLQLASVLTHLDPPSGCGPIRLDRFSPNFDCAEEMGLINVRPANFYKYIYPFDRATLFDLIYYFDFDYKQEIDQGGLVPAIEDTVRYWKNRSDKLEVTRVREQLVIRDSRPVAMWREMTVGGIAARIYEYCDRAQSLSRIVEVMRDSEPKITEEQVARILDGFIDGKLMVKEGNRYLSLGVLTYSTEFERQENERPESSVRAQASESTAVHVSEIAPAPVAG
jgi:ribosomal peptide maturation radical SAM protein 1